MIDTIWSRLEQFQNCEFYQIKGQVFTYKIVGNNLIPSTTNIKIHKSQFERALKYCPLENTVPIQNLMAPSYLFALLTDKRIIDGVGVFK